MQNNSESTGQRTVWSADNNLYSSSDTSLTSTSGFTGGSSQRALAAGEPRSSGGQVPNFTVSSVLTASQIAGLFQLVYFEPYPVSQAAKYLRIDNKKLLDFLVTNHGKSFFTTSHMESQGAKSKELWVRVNSLNLIQRKAKIKPVAHERAHTIKRVLNTQGFCEYNRKSKKPHWLNNIYQLNQRDFINYKNRINHKALVFAKDPTKPENFFAPLLTLPYSTRFTDKQKQKATRAKYFSMWENAAACHTKALMVTITEDPKLHDNLWETNKSHSQGINNFVSFLKKRVNAEINRYPDFKILYEAVKRGVELNYESLSGLKGRYIRKLYEQYRRDHQGVTYQEFKVLLLNGSLTSSQLSAIILDGYTASSHFKNIPADYEFKYINVGEYQLNGRLHSHFLIFGLDYLMDVRELSAKLPDYGLGSITHIYALKKNPNNPAAWTWKNPKNQPKDARNKDPVDYLKVYLLKAQYATAVNYWVFNSRYYTNSRNFEPMDERIAKALLRKQKRLAPRYWSYIGTIDATDDQFSNVRYVTIEEYVKVANSILQVSGGGQLAES